MNQAQQPQRKPKGDYRIFVGIFFSGEFNDEIQKVRQHYDEKTSQITAPHVTMAGTYWRNGEATPENEQEVIGTLQSLQDVLPPFTAALGGIRHFGRRVAFLDVEKTPELLFLREKLIEALGEDKHGGTEKFAPHLTLAMRLKKPQVDKMVEELQETEWETKRWELLVNELCLMQRGPNDPAWRTIGRFPLQGPPK